MKKILGILALMMLFYLGGFQNAYAEMDVDSDSLYQISFIHPIQIIDDKKSIYGLRLNLGHGKNYDVYGVDLGLFNETTHYQKGLQVGFVNSTLKMTGLQIGLVNTTDFLEGVQIGLLNFHTHGMRDFFPIVNWSF